MGFGCVNRHHSELIHMSEKSPSRTLARRWSRAGACPRTSAKANPCRPPLQDCSILKTAGESASMRRSWIERIRERIRLQQYDMTAHAAEEMAEDRLNIVDVEHAVLTGRVAQIQRDDPRGNRYVTEGTAMDGANLVGVVGRFSGSDRYLVVTVYRIA